MSTPSCPGTGHVEGLFQCPVLEAATLKRRPKKNRRFSVSMFAVVIVTSTLTMAFFLYYFSKLFYLNLMFCFLPIANFMLPFSLFPPSFLPSSLPFLLSFLPSFFLSLSLPSFLSSFFSPLKLLLLLALKPGIYLVKLPCKLGTS